MAKWRIPQERVICGVKQPQLGTLHSDGGPACPVCDACFIPVWGSPASHDVKGNQLVISLRIYMLIECYNCRLWEGGLTRPTFVRVGWWKVSGHPDPIPTNVREEATRLARDAEELTIRPDMDAPEPDYTHWLVYADWLDEHGYPINATAVRMQYGGQHDQAE